MMELDISSSEPHHCQAINSNDHNNNNNTNNNNSDGDEDCGISAIQYHGSEEGRGKHGFITNVVNKFDKKQRKFTGSEFATNVGINGLVNGIRENYQEFNGPQPKTCDVTVDGVVDEGGTLPVPPVISSHVGNGKSSGGKLSGKHLPLSMNFTALKEKISPTGIKLPPGLSKMKNSFTGSRKETLPTYVAATIRRGSDVKSLVDDDSCWNGEEQSNDNATSHSAVATSSY